MEHILNFSSENPQHSFTCSYPTNQPVPTRNMLTPTTSSVVDLQRPLIFPQNYQPEPILQTQLGPHHLYGTSNSNYVTTNQIPPSMMSLPSYGFIPQHQYYQEQHPSKSSLGNDTSYTNRVQQPSSSSKNQPVCEKNNSSNNEMEVDDNNVVALKKGKDHDHTYSLQSKISSEKPDYMEYMKKAEDSLVIQ